MTKSGFQHFNAGNLGEAEIAFRKQLIAEPTNHSLWHSLALTYALQKSPHKLVDLVNLANSNFDFNIDFVINIFIDLVSQPYGFACAEKLSDSLSKGHPTQVIAEYFAGCSFLEQGNIECAFDKFEHFRDTVINKKELFPMTNSSNMNVIFRQAFLVERPKKVEMIDHEQESSFPTYEPEIIFDKTPYVPEEKNTPILISCCNGIYLQTFGEIFIQSVIENCPQAILHLHIADPTAISKKIISNFRIKHPTFKLNHSIEALSPFSGSIYFSCNRFLLATKFLSMYNSKIIISDIDGLFKTDLYQLLEYTKDHDFSCFSCEKNEPASKYQAGITCFANNNQTFKFAQLLSKFIRLKIHLPDGISWMLDQAALFSVIKYLEQDGNFKFNDISENTGLKLTHFFKPYDNQREKLKLMRLGS